MCVSTCAWRQACVPLSVCYACVRRPRKLIPILFGPKGKKLPSNRRSAPLGVQKITTSFNVFISLPGWKCQGVTLCCSIHEWKTEKVTLQKFFFSDGRMIHDHDIRRDYLETDKPSDGKVWLTIYEKKINNRTLHYKVSKPFLSIVRLCSSWYLQSNEWQQSFLFNTLSDPAVNFKTTAVSTGIMYSAGLFQPSGQCFWCATMTEFCCIDLGNLMALMLVDTCSAQL